MKRVMASVIFTIPVLLIAVGCSADDRAVAPKSEAVAVAKEPAATAMASVPEHHRRKLARAFENADAGRSPTMACTGVIASAAGNPLASGVSPDPDNVRAFELCYVDASVRYIEALLAQITATKSSEENADICAKIASYALISRTSLGSFAANIHLDVATLDARIATRLDRGMTAKCPEQKQTLLGNH